MFSLGYVLSSVPPSCVTSTPRHYKTVTMAIRSRGKCLWSRTLLKSGEHSTSWTLSRPPTAVTYFCSDQSNPTTPCYIYGGLSQSWFRKRGHISLLLTSLQSLPVFLLLDFKIVLFVSKCLLGLAPSQALGLATLSLLVLPKSFRRRKPSWGGTFLVASDPPARQANSLTHCFQKPPQNSPLVFGFLTRITPHK